MTKRVDEVYNWYLFLVYSDSFGYFAKYKLACNIVTENIYTDFQIN